ncbi:polycystin-1-like protein 1 [Maylandia zebra]|uniref:polycystin-1-like protein 1 n=1 Tax=Maylandia zebra TaxID=106582 RepID=UPI00403CED87
MALYRTEGPFLHNISVFTSPARLEAGKTFVIEVKGNLAGRSNQPPGILGLSSQALTYVTVESLGMTLKVNVMDDGSFTVSSDWILNVAGKYEINITVSNPLSTLSSTLHLYILPPFPGNLTVSLLHGPLNVPSCIPTVHLDSDGVTEGVAAYWADPVTLQAFKWTFESEGVHAVSVNASCLYGWKQKTIHVVVLSPGCSHLKGILCGNHLTSAVRIFAARQAYPTNTDIIFQAVTDVPDPVFVWHFGDYTSATTTSRIITRKYLKPGRYNVSVIMSHGKMAVTSDMFPVVVQRTVKLNRLVHRASVLQNHTVVFSCRVNMGTDINFLWSFGDGTSRSGQSTERHIFHRTGEFRVEVTASNLVSSASLSSHIFVVDQPCQPPPVKNMGPLKLQVRRYEVVHLGVTYETEVDCDVSRGLRYSWTLFDSAGQAVPLPLTDTHRQILIVQSHLLEYDTYTATARVQVVGSVVYSNYSVKVQVMPSPPVAFIQGGTNIFLNNRNTIVTLDGQASYDPDFPTNPLSYSWACKPVSTITSSCFNQHIPTSSLVLKFPASFLKTNFDQFQFTLTVQSGERSASSETFLTVTSNLIGKLSIYCPECRGDRVNWDQSFSVGTVCEACHIPARHIQYTWSLYLVNASSKPFTEVPFCHTVDLSTMSAIMESPATSTLHPPVTNVSQNTQTTPYSSSSAVTVATFETRNGDVDLADSGASTTRSGDTSDKAALPESSPRVLNNDGVLYSDYLIQGDISSETSVESDSSADWDFSFRVLESSNAGGRLDPDYGAPFPNAEEGDPGMSAGRPRGEDGERFSAGDVSMFDMGLHKDEGSNLVDSKPFVAIQAPTLLDLPRNPLNRGLFESFTYTGISCSFLKIKPFSLRPRSRYMLEVTAKSQSRRLGRTQLFLQTNPVPEGLACQVQPVRGLELHTHFSIFCTSGKEDLVYEYSFSVGDRLPRTLYQGRDFQYYFSLPSGDPRDDYKVTIYTEIRSSTYGSATKPCPVTVQVQPSFLRDTSSSSSHHDPDLELSESGLRNLSALVQLGNSMEIRNYISLLTSILNRLSLETEANTHAQRHMRTVLIRTLCELESSDQESMTDNICILNDLLRVTSQVTLASAKRVTAHIQMMSEQFSASSAYRHYIINQKVLNTALTLLSHSLQVVTTCTFTPDITQEDSTADGNLRNDENTPNSTAVNSSTSGHIKQGRSPPAKQAVMLVADILQAASELMLKYILFHETKEHRVSSSLINLYAASQNNTSTVINSGSVRVYMPASFIQILFLQHGPCVLTVLTELAHSPYTWANPTQVSGPVVDLSLYKCNTRRRIHVSSLIQPFNTELRHTQRNKSSSWEFALLRSRVNYHSFNITQEHLLQSIQFTLLFRPTTKKAFPLMVLFRMFEKPTPRMHHLRKIYRWESNTSRITLPSSYLSAAGVGHLALLNADFGKAPRANHLTEEISYSLTVDSSLCLSWDGQQGAWTHQGCRTQLADTDSAVSCSCHRLRPLTVKQQQIQSIHSTADVNPFLSASTDLTVLGMLLLFVCLYVAGLAACKRADVVATQSQRVHYLSDNSASDPYLYAVTTHTGLSSAARMSAKVYISLYGEDGFSQTKELHVPGCTLFRRNSKDIFILSAAESLGPVWGVHIWHDNSGPSPDWYLTQVEVSEVLRGHVVGCSWLFAAQCWLAANKGDGRVERMLRVCTQGINFAQMLRLKLNDYLADFHTWVSVYSCPSPSSFTHTQRLSVCLLLLLGYACVGAVIVAQTDDQPLFALGFVDVSAGAVTNGLVSVVAVLPVATAVSFLFRLRAVQPTGSRVHRVKCRKTEKEYSEDPLSLSDGTFDRRLSWSSLQQWDESWMQKYQDADLSVSYSNVDEAPHKNKSEFLPGSSRFHETQRACLSRAKDEGQKEKGLQGRCSPDSSSERGSYYDATDKLRERPTCQRRVCLAWTLCLLLSLSCLVLSAVLGMRFNSGKVLLWVHSLFISLMSCIFIIQPALILAVALAVSCWHRKTSDFHTFFRLREFNIEAMKLWSHRGINGAEEQLTESAFTYRRRSHLKKLLRARRRARYLGLVRPPTLAELRKTHRRKRREAVIHKTLRDLSLSVAMLSLMMCITYDSSFREHYQLNRAVRRHFVRNRDHSFMLIQKHTEWWNWSQTGLIESLYEHTSAQTEVSYDFKLQRDLKLQVGEENSDYQPHIVIGEPILQKIEISDTSPTEVPVMTSTTLCGRLSCYSGPSATVGLGHTKSDSASKLKLLRSAGWLDGRTVALKVQFTLYSPAPNLFTSVTLLAERSPTGVLLPSVEVHSVRVHHTPTAWDYAVMVCKLLFLFLSLIQISCQVSSMGQQGLIGYWTTPCSWVEVGVPTATLVHYVCHIYHSAVIMSVAELLERNNHRGRVDVRLLASWEQFLRTLRGIMLFLLTIKCVAVLRVNRTFATPAKLLSRLFSSLLWPMISGVILLMASSCLGHLLHIQSSWAVSPIHVLLRTLPCVLYRGLRATSNNRGLLHSDCDVFTCGVLYLSAVVWTAVVIGVMSSLVRSARRSHSRRNLITIAELANYIRLRVSELTTGQHEEARIDNHTEGRAYYLEECESLVDELLFRLNALSDSLHLKAHRYRKESPVISLTPEPSNMDSQGSARSQIIMNGTHSDDQCLLNLGGTSTMSHLFRSQANKDILQQRGQTGCNPSSNFVVASDDSLKGKKCPESAGKSQTAYTTSPPEVVVKVLVHEDPARAVPDKH